MPDPNPKLVDLKMDFLRESPSGKATLYLSEDGDEVWLPNSQHEYDQDSHEVTLPEWLAIEKGLI